MPQQDLGPYRTSRFGSRWDYLISVGFVLLCTAIALLVGPRIELTNFVILYLLGTVVVSLRCRRGPAILNAVLGVSAFYYFCIPIHESVVVEDPSYIIPVIGMLTVALVISTLTVKIRIEAVRAMNREERTWALYRLSRELAKETSLSGAVKTATYTTADVFNAHVELYMPDQHGALRYSMGTNGDGAVSRDARAVQAVFESGQRQIKLFTDQSAAACLSLPLAGSNSILGVMSLVSKDRERFSDVEQLNLLEVFCTQTAVAIERARNSEAARNAELEVETERMRSSLLSAVSHDMKTPLASIYGSATSLLEEGDRLGQADRLELVESIADEAERLNRVVTNLLEMTRLDAGVQLRKEWHPLEEIIGAALTQLEKPLRGRPVTTQIPADLPLIYVDDVLLEQVFINLLENVVKYTAEGTSVEVLATKKDSLLTIIVQDRGPGFPIGSEQRIFEKFFRANADGVRGVGLGLAICRAIMQRHQGVINAENRLGGGAVVRLDLPIGDAPPEINDQET